MKIQKCRKGQIRILEAFFAALLIFSALFLIPAPSTMDNEHSDSLRKIGINALLQLDSDGSLSRLIENGDWNALRNLLWQTLPNGIWFNLTILDSEGNQLNDIIISNGGQISDAVVSVKYVCAASDSTYSIYILHLQLARAD